MSNPVAPKSMETLLMTSVADCERKHNPHVFWAAISLYRIIPFHARVCYSNFFPPANEEGLLLWHFWVRDDLPELTGFWVRVTSGSSLTNSFLSMQAAKGRLQSLPQTQAPCADITCWSTWLFLFIGNVISNKHGLQRMPVLQFMPY